MERDDPEVCHIGRLVRASARKLRLLEIDPDAKWDDKPTTWPLCQITRVDAADTAAE